MRRSPSIVPNADDREIYLVLDDFGERLGRAWRETDDELTDRETLIADLMAGQYKDPVRVAAFNTAEGWSRDVSEAGGTPCHRAVRGAGRIAELHR